jgi:hypothetical protein
MRNAASRIQIARLMAGEASTVSLVPARVEEWSPNDAAITGKGMREVAFAAATLGKCLSWW